MFAAGILAADPLGRFRCMEGAYSCTSHGYLIGLGAGEFRGKVTSLSSLLCYLSSS